MIKKVLCTVLTAVLLATSTTVGVLAKENNVMEYNISEEELQEYFNENDIPLDKQEILRNKVLNGIAWDCYDAEKVNAIPEEFSYFDINDKDTNRKYIFEDGSFIEISINPGENSQIEDNERKITSSSYGTLYTNHKVSKTVGLTSTYFYANFYVARYGESRIYTEADGYNSPYGEGVSGFGVTQNPSKEMIRKVEDTNGSQAALFRLYWFNKVEVSGTWGAVSGTLPIGSTCNLYLALIRNKMYVASELPF